MATAPTPNMIRTAREENMLITFHRALASGDDAATARRAALAANGIIPDPMPVPSALTRADIDARVSLPARTSHVARHASVAPPVTGGRDVRDRIRERGNCASLSHEDSERLATNARSSAIARVCQGCPVADACAAYAVACETGHADSAVGIYGGRAPKARHAAADALAAALAALGPVTRDDEDDDAESPWVAVAGNVRDALALRDAVRLAEAHAAHAERLFA